MAERSCWEASCYSNGLFSVGNARMYNPEVVTYLKRMGSSANRVREHIPRLSVTAPWTFIWFLDENEKKVLISICTSPPFTHCDNILNSHGNELKKILINAQCLYIIPHRNLQTTARGLILSKHWANSIILAIVIVNTPLYILHHTDTPLYIVHHTNTPRCILYNMNIIHSLDTYPHIDIKYMIKHELSESTISCCNLLCLCINYIHWWNVKSDKRWVLYSMLFEHYRLYALVYVCMYILHVDK